MTFPQYAIRCGRHVSDSQIRSVRQCLRGKDGDGTSVIGPLDHEDNMELNEKVMIFIVMASEKFKKKSSAIIRRHGLTFSHYCV